MTGVYGAADERQCIETLLVALDRGVNFIDTSDAYGEGENEKLLRRILRGRENVIIATKFGLTGKVGPSGPQINNTRQFVIQACEASLRRLGIEALDLYYPHRRDPQVPIEELVGTLADLVRAGKVRQLGLCEVSSQTLRRAQRIHAIAAVQSEYSLWSRDPEAKLLDTCRELGITFVAYAPLGRALLAGSLASVDQLAPTDIRRLFPRFQSENFATNLELANLLRAFATQRGMTSAQVALAWLMTKGVVAIPGTKRAHYMIENAAAGSLVLTTQEVAQLDALFPPNVAAGARSPQFALRGTEQEA